MTSKHTPSIALNTLASLLSAALAGCAHSQASSPSPDNMPPAVAASLPLLLADAAQRSGVPQHRLRVVRAAVVTWPDGSLGCPQPGFGYTQALVPGWQVIIAVPSSAVPLHYHGSDRGRWVHCPAGRAQPALDGDRNPRS